MLKRYPLVYVEWLDHSADGRWSEVEDEDKTADLEDLCASVGWLFRDRPKYLLIISSVNEEGTQIGNKQFIYKDLIKKVQYLRGKPKDAYEVVPNRVAKKPADTTDRKEAEGSGN